MFDHLLGNAPIKAYLKKAVESHRLPHALLFAGPSGVGKSLFAKSLAATLLETTLHRIETEIHPDFHSVHPDSKSAFHSIDSLRLLIDEVHSSPFEAPGKVFLIYDAERMQPAAANALLKTLEEPTLGTTFILVTHHESELLATIRSRCVCLFFQPLSEQEIVLSLQKKGYPETFAKLAQGSLGRAIDLATRPSLERPLFDLLAQKYFLPDLLSGLEKLDTLIEDEDPVRKNQNAEHLFTAFLLWHRDQHARKMHLPKERLFFPDEPETKQPLSSLEQVMKSLDEARIAFQRNIKLSVCLYQAWI